MPLFFRNLHLPDDVFTDALRKAKDTRNPKLDLEVDFFLVFSGRTTVMGKLVDRLDDRPVGMFDKNDDRDRILQTLKLREEILQQTGKKVPIFYNGLEEHNQALRKWLRINPQYADIFIIQDIDPKDTKDTLGQIGSFIKYIKKEGINIKKLAVSSSRYHVHRIECIINFAVLAENQKDEFSPEFNEYVADMLANMQVFLHGIDDEFKCSGIEYDVAWEHKVLTLRSSGAKPTLSRHGSRTTFLNDIDAYFEKSFAAQKRMETPTWLFENFEKLRRIKTWPDNEKDKTATSSLVRLSL